MASSLGPRGALWMDSFGLIERGLPRTPGNGRDWRTRNAPYPWMDRERLPGRTSQAALGCRAGFRLRNSSAIRRRFLASTAAPTKTSNRSRPLARQRFIPRPRNSTEIRPSMPTRKRCPCLNARLRSKVSCSAVFCPPRWGMHTCLTPASSVVHIVGTVKAPIAGVHFGRMLEDLLMTVQRSLHLGAVGGIAVQNLIVGDQALGTLGQEDLVTELHRLALLAPLDQMRVGLEDGVHLLVGRNLLSVEYPPTGLVNDLLAQVAVSRDLLAELVDGQVAEHVDTLDLGGLFDDLARAFQHLPGDAE